MPQKIALLSLFSNLAWEYAFKNVKENQKELIINWVQAAAIMSIYWVKTWKVKKDKLC